MSVEHKEDQVHSMADEQVGPFNAVLDMASQRVIVRGLRNTDGSQPLVEPQPVTALRPTATWTARAISQLQWPARGVWLGLGAWVLALCGTLLLAQDSTRNISEWLLFLSGVVCLVAWSREKWLPAFAPYTSVRFMARPKLRYLYSVAGFALGSLTAWLADSSYLSKPTETFGQAGWLWLLSIALILAAALAWPRTHIREAHGHAALPVNSTVPVRRGVFGSALPAKELGISAPAWASWEVASLVWIVLLALVLRLWDLSNVPFAFHFDEIITGRQAHAYMNGGSYPPVFSTVWEGIDLPALWFTFTATSLNIFGTELLALRIPAALFGAATVLPFYGMVRGVWGRTAALVGTTILAFSAVDIHYSRVTLNNIIAPFFWAICFFFLLRGLRTRRPMDWLAAGTAGGLSEYFYYGTRLLPFVLGAFALYLLVVHWRQGWRYLGHFALVALGYMVALGPLFAYFTAHPDLYFGRSKGAGVLTWDHIPNSWNDLVLMWNTLWPLISDNLLGISTNASRDSVYAGSLLMQAEAALLVLGVALLIFRWRQPAAFLMLIAGFGVVFVGGTLIHGTPYIAHWTPAFPAIYAAIAAPVGAWASAGAQLPGRVRLLVPLALFVGVSVLGVMNVYYYFYQYKARPPEELRTAQDRAQAALGTGYRVFDVGASTQGWDFESMGYLAPGQEGGNLYNPAAELPLPSKAGKGLGFFFYSDNDRYRPLVRAIYPGGADGDVTASDGTHLFFSYVLTPEQVEGLYGVNLQLYAPSSNQLVWNGQVHSVGTMPLGASYPIKARWSAAVYISATTLYQLRVEGLQANLLVNGQANNLSGEQTLSVGWNQVVVEANLQNASKLQFMLGTDGGPLAEVSIQQLWPVVPGQGLLGVSAAIGVSQVARVDPFIGFSGIGLPNEPGPGQSTGQPTKVRWVGAIYAVTEGQYSLGISVKGQARLWVDGKAALAGCSPADSAIIAKLLYLDPGWHKLQLDYAAVPSTSILELYWTPPGEQNTIVPPSALCYLCDGSDIGISPLHGVSLPAIPDSVECTTP